MHINVMHINPPSHNKWPHHCCCSSPKNHNYTTLTLTLTTHLASGFFAQAGFLVFAGAKSAPKKITGVFLLENTSNYTTLLHTLQAEFFRIRSNYTTLHGLQAEIRHGLQAKIRSNYPTSKKIATHLVFAGDYAPITRL